MSIAPPIDCPKRLPFMALIAVFLAGCASLAPPYDRPTIPVAAVYSSDSQAPGANVASVGWREYFTDPRLQSLIALALDNNRDLRNAVLRVSEARAAYGIESAQLLPAIGAWAGVDRSRTPADLSFTGKPLIASDYQVGLGLASWEIDFWGRIRSLQDAALEEFLATDAARRAASIELVAQVANAYLALRGLDERIALARQTIATREQSFRIFTRRVEVGSTSRFNLTEVQTLLTQAQTLGIQLELARAAQFNALALLIGTPVALPPEQGQLDEHTTFVDLRAGLPSDLLVQRPDIVAAEHRLKAANANIGAARAAFFPRIALTASLGTASAELNGLFAEGSHAWAFSPSISLPIFDAGRRKNTLTLTEVRKDMAVSHYEKTVQIAFRDVSDALSARHGLTRQVEVARQALTTQLERARLSQLRFDNGASAFLDVLDAQRDLLDAEQRLVQVRRSLQGSHVSLYAALGGGSQDFSRPSDPPATDFSRTTSAP